MHSKQRICKLHNGTQHGKRYQSGRNGMEMVTCSKSHFKGVVEENVKIRAIILKTWTKVEFSGQNDNNNRNIKGSMTIASWEISDVMFLNFRC